MNANSGMVWERTRAIAERAARDPKARESAAELLDRLRELAIEDRRRGIGRMLLVAAVVVGALAALAGVMLRRPGRSGAF